MLIKLRQDSQSRFSDIKASRPPSTASKFVDRGELWVKLLSFCSWLIQHHLIWSRHRVYASLKWNSPGYTWVSLKCFKSIGHPPESYKLAARVTDVNPVCRRAKIGSNMAPFAGPRLRNWPVAVCGGLQQFDRNGLGYLETPTFGPVLSFVCSGIEGGNCPRGPVCISSHGNFTQ